MSVTFWKQTIIHTKDAIRRIADERKKNYGNFSASEVQYLFQRMHSHSVIAYYYLLHWWTSATKRFYNTTEQSQRFLVFRQKPDTFRRHKFFRRKPVKLASAYVFVGTFLGFLNQIYRSRYQIFAARFVSKFINHFGCSIMQSKNLKLFYE